jgi:hypothetical protein
LLTGRRSRRIIVVGRSETGRSRHCHRKVNLVIVIVEKSSSREVSSDGFDDGSLHHVQRQFFLKQNAWRRSLPLQVVHPRRVLLLLAAAKRTRQNMPPSPQH